MLSMNYQITIKTLKKQGCKNTHIANQVGCHRNTVKQENKHISRFDINNEDDIDYAMSLVKQVYKKFFV